MATRENFKLEASVEPLDVPKRLAFIKKETSALVKAEEEDLVTSYPHLLLRLLVGFEVLVILLSVLSLLFDAPLEEFADPDHTPNPAKAPWYFLGLQELLHLFPPFVAGVLLPALVVIALVVIPYFEINIKREGLWKNQPGATFKWLTGVALILVAGLSFLHAFSVAIPTLIIYGLMVLPYIRKNETGLLGWLGRLSLAEWIMAWFVMVATVLTLIGILFRGPGWEWTWPWYGIY